MARQHIASGIKFSVAAIVLLLILLYAYAKGEPYLFGPRIDIISPKSGESVSLSSSVISGNIQRAAHITLNGRQVFTDEAGGFNEEVFLAEGLNIFEIVATDRFGRESKKVLEVLKK